MPLAKRLIDEVVSDLSDMGWEKNSVEFDIDMLPDEDDGFANFIRQHDDEIHFAFTVPEYKWNKNIKKHIPEPWEMWEESDN